MAYVPGYSPYNRRNEMHDASETTTDYDLLIQNIKSALGPHCSSGAGVVESVALLRARADGEWSDELVRVAAVALKRHLLAAQSPVDLPADSQIESAFKKGIEAADFIRCQTWLGGIVWKRP